jgi:hypothetical protein
MKNYPKLKIKDLPKAPNWKKALGVGLVVMGMAIGTGELIMWPHLISKFGLGILWAALVGIGMQYFINQEVARHSLATGESFFTSSARILKWFAPFWFISALLLYIWPGWASAMGTTLNELFGVGHYMVWAWASLVLVLILTFSGRIAYVTLETSLKIIVPIFIALLVVVSFLNLELQHLIEAARGLVNFGWLPEGIDIKVLLGAIVFAGAGGMLNLCISLWYRDKQAGMGKHVGRITNPITGKPEAVAATGFTFKPTKANLKRWKQWMNFVRVDQGIIFFAVGLFTLVLLSINAYAVLEPRGLVPEGLDVAVVQAHIFGESFGVIGYKVFLVMAFLMLFAVMWTVFDAVTRMVSDILYVNCRAGFFKRFLRPLKGLSESHLYYITISVLVLIGAFLIPLQQPLTFLVISSVLGGLTMAIYTPVLIYLNNFKLPKEIRPGWITNIFMSATFLFYAFFTVLIILNYFNLSL